MPASPSAPGAALTLELLQRLARGATQGELEHVLDAAGSRLDLSAGELAKLTVATIALNSDLEARRHREAVFHTLSDSVADLAAERDPERLLHRIALRAQNLLGADAVYLVLADFDAGATYFGATAGAVTPELASLRVPLGVGIAARVIATGIPMTTRDYLSDPEIIRDEAGDRVMRQEGIKAAVGVPLRVGSQILGALVAGTRGMRTWSSADSEILADLATHAALSMERTRLLEQSAAALARLERANQELVTRHAETERATASHLRFAQVVLSGQGLDGVATAVANILGGRVAIVDGDGRPLALTADLDLEDPRLTALRDSSRGSRETRIHDDAVAVPVVAGDRVVGVLLLIPLHAIGEADIRILERAAIVAALVLLRGESEAGQAALDRGELMEDLVEGRIAPARLIRRAAAARLDLTGEICALAVRAAGSRRELTDRVHVAAAAQGGLAAVHHGEVVALIPSPDARGAADRMHAQLRSGADIIAAAGPGRGVAAVPELVRQAVRCGDALLALHGKGAVGTMADLGFLGLVLGGGADSEDFISRTIGRVLDYDAHRGTALTETLHALLDAGGSLRAAADRLHVHVNTVKQRMARLTELLGATWRDPTVSTELHLALRLHAARAATETRAT